LGVFDQNREGSMLSTGVRLARAGVFRCLYLVHLNDEMIIEDLVTLPVHSYMVGMAFSIDAFASQGPVREIDHPPQLS
jgi:hypothetical protein